MTLLNSRTHVTSEPSCPPPPITRRHLRNTDGGDGTEVRQLLEVHASWFNDFSQVKMILISFSFRLLMDYEQ